jgi:hypothetical protein
MREGERKGRRADHKRDSTPSTADDHPIDKPDNELEPTKDSPEERRSGTATWGSEGSAGSVPDARPDDR